jgi:hypothetical protein
MDGSVMVFPLLAFMISIVLPLGAVGFFGWLALRFVRAREREALREGNVDSPEVRRLREQVESLQTEIDGIRERQDFVERLLERPRTGTQGGQ